MIFLHLFSFKYCFFFLNFMLLIIIPIKFTSLILWLRSNFKYFTFVKENLADGVKTCNSFQKALRLNCINIRAQLTCLFSFTT